MTNENDPRSLGMVTLACDPSPWVVEEEGSEIQVHPWLHSTVEAQPGYVSSSLHPQMNHELPFRAKGTAETQKLSPADIFYKQ